MQKRLILSGDRPPDLAAGNKDELPLGVHPIFIFGPHAEALGPGQGYCVRESIAQRSREISFMVTVAADPSLGTKID